MSANNIEQFRLPANSELASRQEWQDDIRNRFPFEEPGNPIQEPYGVTSYPIKDVGVAALHSLVNKIPSAAVDTHLGNNIVTTPSWANFSLSQQEKKISNMTDTQNPEDMLPSLLETSAWRRALLQGDIDATSSDHLAYGLSVLPNQVEQGVAQAIEDGYMSGTYWDRYKKSLQTTRVRTVSPAVGRSVYTSAHYDSYRNEIVSHDSATGDSSLSEVISSLGHEYGHSSSGGTFERKPDGTIYRTRVGFVNDSLALIPPEHSSNIKIYKKTGWDEATNEHKNQSLLHGAFETIDPDIRNEQGSAYPEYRKVLAEAYRKSGGMMKVSTLTRAHEEDTGQDGSLSARKAFVREVVDTYGWGSIGKIDKLMQHAMQEPQNIKRVLECIHAPEFDSQGVLITKGWIEEYQDIVSRMFQDQKKNNELVSSVASGTSFGDSLKDTYTADHLPSTLPKHPNDQEKL